MTRKKVAIIIGVLLIGAAVVGANLWYRRDTGVTVAVEPIRQRDLADFAAHQAAVAKAARPLGEQELGALIREVRRRIVGW